jgi:putative IMPACT (imprinted ancient) family translation regulator
MIKQWSVSNILTLKKSKFKAFCIPIKNHDEISELITELPTLDKNVNKASHPAMYAWKTANSNSKLINLKKLDNLNQGFNDNGEGGAGLRLQGMLDRLKLINILVIVSRWYGGTPLGPARFKCISDVGMEALKIGGYLNINPDKGWIDCLQVNSNTNNTTTNNSKRK